MTEDDARQRLVELDHRYRMLLHSTGELNGAIRKKYFACQQEFINVRRKHPLLSAKLEEKFRQACAGELETNGRWPKRDEWAVEHSGIVPTASDLMNFAYAEGFDLFGGVRHGLYSPCD
jgi:hypothetical protein